MACRLPFKIKQAGNESDKAIKYYTAAEFPMRYHPEGGHTHFRQPKGRPHKEAAAKTTADKTECAVLNVRGILQGKPKGTHSFLPARSPQHGRENHDRRKRLPTIKHGGGVAYRNLKRSRFKRPASFLNSRPSEKGYSPLSDRQSKSYRLAALICRLSAQADSTITTLERKSCLNTLRYLSASRTAGYCRHRFLKTAITTLTKAANSLPRELSTPPCSLKTAKRKNCLKTQYSCPPTMH